MKISKILNNNAVIVTDEKEEKIAIGTGVGFKKGKNDLVNKKMVEKLFVLKENEKLQQLLIRIPEEHLLITEKVITYAEKHLQTELNEHILLVLADHISFAIEREKDGIHLKNKLLHEIKILYKKEFEIGLWAIELISEKAKVEMPIDEAAFIALHIHTMKIKGGDLHETVRQTTILRDMVQTIQTFLGITFLEEDISYDRLITHLRFAISRTRVNKNTLHTMDSEMFEMIKNKFTNSYRCAEEVANELAINHDILMPEEELGYITLHIERLNKSE